jgi:hypothetical protein
MNDLLSATLVSCVPNHFLNASFLSLLRSRLSSIDGSPSAPPVQRLSPSSCSYVSSFIPSGAFECLKAKRDGLQGLLVKGFDGLWR